MTYFEKVKASREVYGAINDLEDDAELYILYGSDTFRVRCLYHGTNKKYSISQGGLYGKSMNIDRLGKTSMSLYTFDLFKNKTTYRLPLYLTKLIS